MQAPFNLDPAVVLARAGRRRNQASGNTWRVPELEVDMTGSVREVLVGGQQGHVVSTAKLDQQCVDASDLDA